jgi:hypothetical protein
MAKVGGYASVISLEGSVTEADTITCAHCNGVVFLHDPNTGSRKNSAAGFCRSCMKATCIPCDNGGTCAPFEKKIAEMEKRARDGRMLDRALGR